MRKLTHSLFLVATASPTLVSVNCQHDIDFSCSSTLVWSGLVWSMYSNLSKKDVLDKNLTQMVKSVREYDDNNNLSVIQASFPLGFSQTFSWDKFANLRRRKRWRPSSLRTITGAPWRETAWDTTLSSTPGDQPASQSGHWASRGPALAWWNMATQLLHFPLDLHHLRPDGPADVGPPQVLPPGAETFEEHQLQVRGPLLQKHCATYREIIYIFPILISTHIIRITIKFIYWF